jgi:hypothetical protein
VDSLIVQVRAPAQEGGYPVFRGATVVSLLGDQGGHFGHRLARRRPMCVMHNRYGARMDLLLRRTNLLDGFFHYFPHPGILVFLCQPHVDSERGAPGI